MVSKEKLLPWQRFCHDLSQWQNFTDLRESGTEAVRKGSLSVCFFPYVTAPKRTAGVTWQGSLACAFFKWNCGHRPAHEPARKCEHHNFIVIPFAADTLQSSAGAAAFLALWWLRCCLCSDVEAPAVWRQCKDCRKNKMLLYLGWDMNRYKACWEQRKELPAHTRPLQIRQRFTSYLQEGIWQGDWHEIDKIAVKIHN